MLVSSVQAVQCSMLCNCAEGLHFSAFHFVSGKKTNNPLSWEYVPSIFEHVSSPIKRKQVSNFQKYSKRKRLMVERKEDRKEAEREEAARREVERAAQDTARDEAARTLLQSKSVGNTEDICWVEQLTSENWGANRALPGRYQVHGGKALWGKNSAWRCFDKLIWMPLNFYTGFHHIHCTGLKAVFDLLVIWITAIILPCLCFTISYELNEALYCFGVSQSTVSEMDWYNVVYAWSSLFNGPVVKQLLKLCPVNLEENSRDRCTYT